MEVKLGAHVCNIVSTTTTTTNSLRHFSLKLLLHSSNLLTVPRMEVKLGAHVYYIVSMMTKTTISLRHFSLTLWGRGHKYASMRDNAECIRSVWWKVLRVNAYLQFFTERTPSMCFMVVMMTWG